MTELDITLDGNVKPVLASCLDPNDPYISGQRVTYQYNAAVGLKILVLVQFLHMSEVYSLNRGFSTPEHTGIPAHGSIIRRVKCSRSRGAFCMGVLQGEPLHSLLASRKIPDRARGVFLVAVRYNIYIYIYIYHNASGMFCARALNPVPRGFADFLLL